MDIHNPGDVQLARLARNVREGMTDEDDYDPLVDLMWKAEGIDSDELEDFLEEYGNQIP